MNPEDKEVDPQNGFGRVVEELHNKQKLSTLRTYQGDMAEFIKTKNESVISVKLKEKERKEKQEEEAVKNGAPPKKDVSKSNFQVNITMIALSLALLATGASVFFYVFSFINRPDTEIKLETDLIPYNSATTIANINRENLREEIGKLPKPNGIDIIKISDSNGKLLVETKDLFDFLEIPNNLSLQRTLNKNFVVGRTTESEKITPFLIFNINDFGLAFSSMLDWENSMAEKLGFLASETITTPENYYWKDVLIKNKDIRAMTTLSGDTILCYTFLDRNAILITGDLATLAKIAELYSSRPVAR